MSEEKLNREQILRRANLFEKTGDTINKFNMGIFTGLVLGSLVNITFWVNGIMSKYTGVVYATLILILTVLIFMENACEAESMKYRAKLYTEDFDQV